MLDAKTIRSIALHVAACGVLLLIAGIAPAIGASARDHLIHVEIPMTHHAKGPFDVKLAPQALAADAGGEGAALARMSIDKQFHGDLEAVSRGEMLSAMGSVKGSAGYVAIEKVSGTLDGRKGSFVLQHNATMTRGTPALNIIVVPDSGTGELVGLTGTMNIVIAPDGKHSYGFDYTIAPAD